MIRAFALAVVGFLVTGCGPHLLELKPAMDRQVKVEQVPLTVGVYYSPEFLAPIEVQQGPPSLGVYYSRESLAPTEVPSARAPIPDAERVIIPVGEASVGILGDALSMLFARVQRVPQSPPLDAEGAGTAGVIEPLVEHLRYQFHGGKPSFAAFVVYRFVLYAPDGTRLGSWVVTGESERKLQRGVFYLRGLVLVAEAVKAAMEDAVRKFALDFHDVPEARKWLRESGVEPPKVSR